MRRLRLVLSAGLLAAGAAGCGSDVPKRVSAASPAPPPALERTKRMMLNFSLGTPVGSEVIEFDSIIEEMKVADPAKALIIKDAFDEFRNKSGQKVEAKAREVLSKL